MIYFRGCILGSSKHKCKICKRRKEEQSLHSLFECGLQNKRVVEAKCWSSSSGVVSAVQSGHNSLAIPDQKMFRPFLRFLPQKEHGPQTIVCKLKPIIFLPGDYICKKGDVGMEMFIVSSGAVQVSICVFVILMLSFVVGQGGGWTQ